MAGAATDRRSSLMSAQQDARAGLEHVVVGPDDKLIVRLPGDTPEVTLTEVTNVLAQMFGGRVLVIHGLDCDITVATMVEG